MLSKTEQPMSVPKTKKMFFFIGLYLSVNVML